MAGGEPDPPRAGGASDLTEDTLLGGRVRLRQPRRGYRAAIDPVLLAAAVPAKPGERVLDVGAGSGAASLCLAWRVPGCTVTGLESRAEAAALARENTAANGLADRVRVLCGDLRRPPPALVPGSFDQVMTNPPHLDPRRARPSPDEGRAAATVEEGAGLARWLAFCLAMARPGGGVTVIHRADRLHEVLAALARGAGGIVVVPLWPKAGRAARRVIVRARKGSRAPTRLVPGLILHRDDGTYTPEAEALLRDGRALEA